MRSFISLIFVLALISSCSLPVVKRNYSPKKSKSYKKLKRDFANTVKKKIAILPILNEAPFGGSDLAVVIRNELRKELARTGTLIFKPSASHALGTSKSIYSGGGTQMVQLSRKATTEGLNFVMFGRITEARVRQKADEIGLLRKVRFFSEVKLELRIFDVSANKVIFQQTLLGYADDQNYEFYGEQKEERSRYKKDLLRYTGRVAARKFVPKVVNISTRLEWSGSVAKIIDNQVYINAGRSSGIRIGDILNVVTEGTEIYDPTTGALLGKTKGNLKGTLEVIDYFGPDGAICVLHSGGAVQEGDIVRLY
jgi:hypothetical protein